MTVVGSITDVYPVVGTLTRMMEKAHHDKQLSIKLDAPEGARFRGERQDLEEMIGNLVDNACKWAQSRVAVEVSQEQQDGQAMIRIVVDDDGRGLTAGEREQVAKRGLRLDESKPGSGLGLSIVVELARLYGGELSLGTAPIGGLRAELLLPGA
jgi:signal transduction histidine kinase